MDHPKSKYQNTWTASEVALLRSLAGRQCGREIAPLVGHTRAATLKKIETLGLRGFAPGRQGHWTDAQMEALRRVARDRPGISSRQFAREQGLGTGAVCHWARKLGIVFERQALWSESQVERLRRLAPAHTLTALAAALGRSARAVRAKAEQLGIKYARQARTRQTPAQPEKPKPLAVCRPLKIRRVRAVAEVCRAPKIVPAQARRRALRPVERSRIEYCAQCGAPVSNWEAHFERMGHRRAS